MLILIVIVILISYWGEDRQRWSISQVNKDERHRFSVSIKADEGEKSKCLENIWG
jgi:hypothetical protein